MTLAVNGFEAYHKKTRREEFFAAHGQLSAEGRFCSVIVSFDGSSPSCVRRMGVKSSGNAPDFGE